MRKFYGAVARTNRAPAFHFRSAMPDTPVPVFPTIQCLSFRTPRSPALASLSLSAPIHVLDHAPCCVRFSSSSSAGFPWVFGRHVCRCDRARNIHARKLPSGAGRTPGQVFRADPFGAVGNGNPMRCTIRRTVISVPVSLPLTARIVRLRCSEVIVMTYL